MRNWVVLLLVSCWALPVAAQDAPYRCQFDGRVSFQDVPCGRARHTSSVLYDSNGMRIPGAVEEHAAGRPGSGAAAGSGVARTAPAKKIDFGPDQTTKMNRASGTIESVLIDARECDWDLKVTKTYTPCVEFLGLMLPGGEFVQAIDVMAELSKDVKFYSENRLRFRSVLSDVQEIERIKEFALVRISR